MRALVKKQRGEGFIELLEVPEPSIGSSDVLVEVVAAGICGSDLMILHDLFPGYTVPVILGHEFAGVAKEVGPGVSRIVPGDRVACETHAYTCGSCTYCRSGLYNLCKFRKGFGYGVDGAFTRYVRVREAIVHKLPDSIQLDEAALLEPLSVVLNALTRNSRIKLGDSVIVIGPGPIGLLSLQVALNSGASQITVVGTDKSKKRLSLASNLGAGSIITNRELNEDLSSGADDYTDSFDVAIIATGVPTSFETALRCVRKGGTVIHIGESTKQASFQFSLIEKKNLSVQGSFSHNWPVWEEAISQAKNKRIVLSDLISHRTSLENWAEGFDLAESGEGVKVLIKP